MIKKFFIYLKNNKTEFFAITLITLFALIFRLLFLFNYGDLWLDELYSWYFASQKSLYSTVSSLITQDIHMPLYFVILHIWMKIFGESDLSMHSCSLVLSLPLIPISFYGMKSLFEKTSGYFASIIFSISSFCIYYSLEARFYGFIFTLSLLSAFFFVKMMKNLDKKYVYGFIIFNLLLIYTYSSAGLLTAMYALSAYFYSKKYLREKLKEFIKVFLIIFIFSIPAIVIIILNLIVMHNQICSFSKDIYVFGKEIFYAILELFYSNDMYSVYEYNINNYRPIWNNLKNPDYFIFVAFPILIGVVGIIKSLLKNDKTLYLFLIPSLMFLCVSFLLAKFGILAFLPKYSAIVFPIFVCSTCVGFTFFEKKYVSILLFLIIISINYVKSIDLYTKLSVEKFRYSTGYLSEFFKDKIKLQKNDLLLIPYSGNKIVRYAPPCKFIDFEADDMLLLKDKKSLKIYFGTDEPDKKNVKNFIRPYVIKDKPVESYEKFLEKYFNFMKKGDRFIFVEYRYECTEPFIQNWKVLQDENFYNKMNLFMLMMSKVTRDTFFVAQKHLVLENLYVDKKGEYIVFEYKKH